MKKNIKSLIVLFVAVLLCQTVSAQNTPDGKSFESKDLVGTKWSMSKEIEGKKFHFALVFEKDSVTNTVIMDEKTTVIRYAYYLSDNFEYTYDFSNIGKDTKGIWLNMFRFDRVDNRQKYEGANMRIFTLTETEFSFGQSPSHPMTLVREK